MLDAFDFTIFLLIMVPIAKEFDVPLVDVLAMFTITLWLRLIGATASGWLADRVGRKIPLMMSILWYSICNFIAGFSPYFWFLFLFRAFLFRALLGIGMGAEWPAGAALAMESWPPRSRGLMSGMLQGSWGIGFLLSSAVYGLFYDQHRLARPVVDWHLAGARRLYIRIFVKEPEIWKENRQKQRQQNRELRVPLFEFSSRACCQHADRLPVDGQQLYHLLHDLGRCSRPICSWIWALARVRSPCRSPCKHSDLPVELPLGLAARTRSDGVGR